MRAILNPSKKILFFLLFLYLSAWIGGCSSNKEEQSHDDSSLLNSWDRYEIADMSPDKTLYASAGTRTVSGKSNEDSVYYEIGIYRLPEEGIHIEIEPEQEMPSKRLTLGDDELSEYGYTLEGATLLKRYRLNPPDPDEYITYFGDPGKVDSGNLYWRVESDTLFLIVEFYGWQMRLSSDDW